VHIAGLVRQFVNRFVLTFVRHSVLRRAVNIRYPCQKMSDRATGRTRSVQALASAESIP
jgi:hypothetical protein